MNVLVLIAGLVSLFTTVGHFAVGSRRFLRPMLAATSGLPRGPLQLFQWMFFALTAGFAGAGMHWP